MRIDTLRAGALLANPDFEGAVFGVVDIAERTAIKITKGTFSATIYTDVQA